MAVPELSQQVRDSHQHLRWLPPQSARTELSHVKKQNFKTTQEGQQVEENMRVKGQGGVLAASVETTSPPVQQHWERERTCAQEAVLVVEGVDSGTVANQRRGLEGLLVIQLHHAEFSLQVNSFPVRRVLNGLVDPPSQLPTHPLPHLRTRADHL